MTLIELCIELDLNFLGTNTKQIYNRTTLKTEADDEVSKDVIIKLQTAFDSHLLL